MFLIKETKRRGPIVLFCAPKTGATSVTWIADRRGLFHVDKKDWHSCNSDCIGDRKVVLTVRDPRSRLLSLWKHFVSERTFVTLGVFVDRMDSLPPFFNWRLVDWYAPVLDRDYELVKIESFHEDLRRHLGWLKCLHLNSTSHGPWEDYPDIISQTEDWWLDDASRFGYLD